MANVARMEVAGFINAAAYLARIEQDLVWDDLTYQLFADVVKVNNTADWPLTFRPASWFPEAV